MDKYRDRQAAGLRLAKALMKYAKHKDTLVLGLPRGGVPVAFEVAKALQVPLDVFIVRKLGVPGQPELALGAIAIDSKPVFNLDIIQELHISKDAIDMVIQKETRELQRRDQAYRGNHPFPTIRDKTIILVDDGIATGATMRAAISALKEKKASRIIVAVPVADKQLYERLRSLVDEMVCPLLPAHLYAVGAWYDNFDQTEDAEVHHLLEEAKQSLMSS